MEKTTLLYVSSNSIYGFHPPSGCEHTVSIPLWKAGDIWVELNADSLVESLGFSQHNDLPIVIRHYGASFPDWIDGVKHEGNLHSVPKNDHQGQYWGLGVARRYSLCTETGDILVSLQASWEKYVNDPDGQPQPVANTHHCIDVDVRVSCQQALDAINQVNAIKPFGKPIKFIKTNRKARAIDALCIAKIVK